MAVQGDTVKAIGDMNQAIRLDPGYQAAYKNRGNVWSDRGAFDKAIVDFTEGSASIRRTSTPWFLAWLSCVLLWSGRTWSAVAQLIEEFLLS